MAEVKVLTKTFAILEFILGKDGAGVVPREIVQEFGITQATAIRLLKILVELGYLEQISRQKGYVPGPMTYLIRAEKNPYAELVERLDPVLDRCARECRVLVSLSGRHHNFRYILKSWNGSRDSVDLVRKFRYNDLHKCMTGRLLLAYAEKSEIQDFLKKNGVPKSVPWPENNTEKNFYAELDAIRRKQEITGYYSGCGVAALPIFKDGRVIAALGVLWPDENRKQDVRRLKQLHQFQKEANELLSGKNLWYNIGNEV